MDLQEAQRLFRQALAAEPDNPVCIERMASILSRRGDIAQAMEYTKRLVALRPEEVGAWVGLARGYMWLRRPAEAIDAYRKAIELDSTQVACRLELIQALSAADRHQEAIERAEKLLETESRNANSRDQALDLLTYGDVLARAGRLDEARAAYQRALGLAPEDINISSHVQKVLEELESKRT